MALPVPYKTRNFIEEGLCKPSAVAPGDDLHKSRVERRFASAAVGWLQ
jgi:hypothetical protein